MRSQTPQTISQYESINKIWRQSAITPEAEDSAYNLMETTALTNR